MEMKKTDSLALLRECVAKVLSLLIMDFKLLCAPTLLCLQEVNRSVESVVLYSSYPRRELSHDMDLHTMLQLQLTPSGVIIVRIKVCYNFLEYTCNKCCHLISQRSLTNFETYKSSA